MKIKTNELTGTALDWAVAKCEGYFDFDSWTPSTDWSQGGLIIEREKINISMSATAPWMAWFYDGLDMLDLTDGETPLIAAMRCYVASKLGDEIDMEKTHA